MMDIRSRVKVVSRRLDTTKDNVGHMQGCRDHTASARYPWRLQHLHRQGRFRWRSDERPVHPLLVARHSQLSRVFGGQVVGSARAGANIVAAIGSRLNRNQIRFDNDSDRTTPSDSFISSSRVGSASRTLLMSESPSVNQAAEFSPRRGVTSINAVRRSPARYRAGWQ